MKTKSNLKARNGIILNIFKKWYIYNLILLIQLFMIFLSSEFFVKNFFISNLLGLPIYFNNYINFE